MSNAILESDDHVLSTLEKDGSRHWLKPHLAKGKFLNWRRLVAYFLIAVFTLLPILKVNGKQAMFLNLAKREFTFFGFTFFPTDTLLLAIFLVGALVSVFLLTSLFGRVWCGWACPQTVYMEFVFRPIERFFEGTSGRGGEPRKEPAAINQLLKYLTYFAICFYLSNTFLAYFVGSDELLRWVRMSPIKHPSPFLLVAAVTFFMLYNFCFFREQLCILACPYGRFQSVLLDDQSLIVSYDERRGEPRGKLQRKKTKTSPIENTENRRTAVKRSLHEIGSNGSLSAPDVVVPQSTKIDAKGDCIDCHKCVVVCPTGIDIRNGLQMECINCTQCIDACDDVMRKIGKPEKLIRYSSKAANESGIRTMVRARVIVYPAVLLILAGAFLSVFLNKQTFTATLLRGPGNQFSIEDGTMIRNQLRLRVVNRADKDAIFRIASLNGKVKLTMDFESIDVPAGKMEMVSFSAVTDFENFIYGSLPIQIEVTGGAELSQIMDFKMLGPVQLQRKKTLTKGQSQD